MNICFQKPFVLLLLLLTGMISCKKQPLSVDKITATQQKIDSTLVENPEIDAFILPYREHLNKTLDSVLAYAPQDLTKNDGKLESSLGNLMADIALTQTQPYFKNRFDKEIDFVLLNHGGMRAPILKGNVTARTAFELMPFENELVVTELSYEKVLEIGDYLIKGKRAHPVANVQLVLDQVSEKASYVHIAKKPLQKDRTYLVLTTDYLQQGGDHMEFFSNPIKLYKTEYKLRNALIDYFKKTDTLKITLDNRLSYAE